MSAVIGSEITKLVFNPSDTGIMNSIITACGGSPLGWYNDPDIALLTLHDPAHAVGLFHAMMIYYVALMGVPKTYIEAARLETSSGFRIFLKVYVPLIKTQ